MLAMGAWKKHWAGTRVRPGRRLSHKTEKESVRVGAFLPFIPSAVLASPGHSMVRRKRKCSGKRPWCFEEPAGLGVEGEINNGKNSNSLKGKL